MSVQDLPYSEIAELFDRNPDEVNEAGRQWLANRQNRNRPLVPDIRLLAALSDLSIASISNFMRGKKGSVSEANAQRLAQLVEIVGYVPSSAAQNLRRQQKHMIGVAVPLSSVSPDFYLEILAGIKREADILGYGSMIFDVTTEEARDEFFLKMPFLGIVDGLIAIGLHIDEKRLRILDQQRVPIAAIHNKLDHSPVVANVLPTSERAFRDLIDQHLIRQHGYRRLALVTLGLSNPLKMGEADRPDWTRKARIEAFREALSANDIPIDENLIFTVAEHSYAEGYKVFEEIAQLNQTLISEEQIEAVVCTSDTLAAAILTASRRNNLAIAVTGFDNLPQAELLDITTVEQRARDVGRLAFRHLYNALVYNRRTGEFPALEEEGIDMQPLLLWLPTSSRGSMSKRVLIKMSEKSSRFAVYLIPPYDVSRPVMEIHQMLRKQFGFTAAGQFQVHATVKGFFKKIEGPVEPLIERLDMVFAEQRPFPIHFNGYRIDEKIGIGLNVYLIDDESNKELYAFRERVVTEVRPFIAPDCDFVASDLGNPYEAHITLAFRDIPLSMYDDVFSYLAQAPLPTTPFVARAFHFLEFFSEEWSGNWWQTLTWRLVKSWHLSGAPV